MKRRSPISFRMSTSTTTHFLRRRTITGGFLSLLSPHLISSPRNWSHFIRMWSIELRVLRPSGLDIQSISEPLFSANLLAITDETDSILRGCDHDFYATWTARSTAFWLVAATANWVVRRDVTQIVIAAIRCSALSSNEMRSNKMRSDEMGWVTWTLLNRCLVSPSVRRRRYSSRQVVKLKFHGSSFPRSILVTSSQGCHEDATRKTASVEFKLK